MDIKQIEKNFILRFVSFNLIYFYLKGEKETNDHNK